VIATNTSSTAFVFGNNTEVWRNEELRHTEEVTQ